MRAFVTGGTGFVGSHLVEALLQNGGKVNCLVRNKLKWLGGLDVQVVKGDLFNADALLQGMHGVNTVYHVAAMTRAPSDEALVRANVEGTMNVLDAAEEAGVERVVVVSSLAAVGPSAIEPLTEQAPLQPISNYGRSKAEMERQIAARAKNLETVIVRPPVVYGPREADIYTLIKAADKQRIFPIIGSGSSPQIEMVYVSDLVDGIITAGKTEEAAGHTYFLGGQRAYSWAEVRDAVRNVLGHPVLSVKLPPFLVGSAGMISEGIGRLLRTYPPLNREKAREAKATWLISSEKARTELGYAPGISLEAGMRRTIEWYRENNWL